MPALRGTVSETVARSILLHGREVAYTLRRSRRRTLGLSIDQRGLTVSIPLRSSIAEAERFIHEKSRWVLAKLDEWLARPQPVAQALADGMPFPFRGGQCTLRLRADLRQPLWQEGFYGHELHMPTASGRALRTRFLRALQNYALLYFGGRIEEYAYTLGLVVPGVKVPPLHLSNARTRWGSCSQRSIHLNWRLILLPPALLDYVVAHELAHLVEMNHSSRFWALVGEMYPDYAEARAALREAEGLLPHW